MSVRSFALAMFVAACGLSVPHSAMAQTCSFSVSDVNFGTVDLTDGSAYDTSANFTASCSGGTAGQTLRLCPNLGSGSGGAVGSNAPRTLDSAGNKVGYNLYSDAGLSTQWGAYTGGGTVPSLLITLDGNGAGTYTGPSTTLYARLFAGQQSKPIGSYTANFTGSPNAYLSWADSSAGNCAAIGITNATAFSFAVSASYSAVCTVTADTMDFGASITTLSSPIDSMATVTTTCSAASPYTIGLNDGLQATGSMQRNMSFGANRLPYQLFQDSNRTTLWGNAGANRKAGTGSGSPQAHQVFGRIPASASTPASGTYHDTVIVTVTY